jgi:hypothetical protein
LRAGQKCWSGLLGDDEVVTGDDWQEKMDQSNILCLSPVTAASLALLRTRLPENMVAPGCR